MLKIVDEIAYHIAKCRAFGLYSWFSMLDAAPRPHCIPVTEILCTQMMDRLNMTVDILNYVRHTSTYIII